MQMIGCRGRIRQGHHGKLRQACCQPPNDPHILISMSNLSTRHHGRAVPIFLLLLLMLVFLSSARAEEGAIQQPAPPTPAAATTDVAKRIDPTDFKNRFDIRTEFNQYATASNQIIVPRLEYALSKSVGLRTELPIGRYDPAVGAASTGIGNLLTRIAWRAVRSEDFALVVGSELTFDTASSTALGSGKHVLAPFAFGAVDLPQAKSVFFPYIQYGKAIGGDSSREDVNFTNIRGSLLTRWPNKVYSFVEYSYWINHQRANVASSQIKAELGQFILPKTGFYVRPGTGLSGIDQRYGMHWSLEFGIRHFF